MHSIIFFKWGATLPLNNFKAYGCLKNVWLLATQGPVLVCIFVILSSVASQQEPPFSKLYTA